MQFLQPVFGIAASALMFGDRLGAPFVAGVLMILAGLALAVMSPARPAPGPADLDTPPSLG